MTHVFLVRHGATVWHAENRYAGRSDVALDAAGRAQAERLALWAGQAGLNAVWSSPLSRARVTAEPSARAAGVGLQVDDRLRELDFGQVEGKTIQEAEQQFPQEIERFKTDPAAHPMPGGEDPRAAALRAQAALRDIVGSCPDGRVLVVAHNTLIRLALCVTLGLPLSSYRDVFPAVRNGALTELRVRGRVVSLLQYNTPLPS